MEETLALLKPAFSNPATYVSGLTLASRVTTYQEWPGVGGSTHLCMQLWAAATPGHTCPPRSEPLVALTGLPAVAPGRAVCSGQPGALLEMVCQWSWGGWGLLPAPGAAVEMMMVPGHETKTHTATGRTQPQPQHLSAAWSCAG